MERRGLKASCINRDDEEEEDDMLVAYAMRVENEFFSSCALEGGFW